ncbi:MAG: fatty acid desaturase [Nitrospinae bacterium]|nr:fatty acid desaturase [Nitrospinota bacterium]MZH41068.1 fatty acid desaturase [Nitrospinota bacterium]
MQQAYRKFAEEQEEFSMSRARELVKDLFRPNPIIYWVDFFISAFLGWGSFVLAISEPASSTRQIFFVVLASFSLYRAASFIHEIAHFKKGSFKVFRWTWNLFCGFPLMIPAFLYQAVHFDHHKQNLYGTEKDGEYFPFAIRGRKSIVVHVLFSFIVPVVFFVRFLVLSPLSLFNKKLRLFLMDKVSALVIDLDYQRPESSWKNIGGWKIQEFSACFYAWVFLGFIMAEIIPAVALVLWYCVEALIFLVNSLRTLGAHRYQNPKEEEMSYSSQMLDSVNIPGNRWVTPLWAPVGLRFHATHHLFPDLPYHALEEAHNRLVQDKDVGKLYGQTVSSGLLSALTQLWKHAAH